MAAFEERHGPRKIAWDCGVPPGHCSGGHTGLNRKYSTRTFKTHGSYDDAFRCNKRYCLQMGLMSAKPQQIKSGKGRQYIAPAMRG